MATPRFADRRIAENDESREEAGAEDMGRLPGGVVAGRRSPEQAADWRDFGADVPSSHEAQLRGLLD
ncbi:hypothetical protein ACWD95_35480, partial [Streptomyces sp. NPDC005069]